MACAARPARGCDARSHADVWEQGSLKKRILQRSNEMEPSEWKDADGHVLATEVLRLKEGKMLPTIELSRDLNQIWRELMLALWVSRLWAGFGAGS
jgi:hypothetical protein